MSLDASLNAETFYRERGYVRLHHAQRVLTPEVHLACTRMRKPRPAASELRSGRRGGAFSAPRPEP